ncbi:thiamine pyrophosphate-dependent enzyme [Streptomyces sp. NRRL B-24484]|uniref:thiamine pyrophosphate-dependent enzyme n=1 Tax=Streptomyces sp. NRRL B-24484 TaxID=1463833 RepID=UPI0006949862|nr:thiamine pyrophosphate-dependent enzyme [Streptomyces sp. NRRL B-24484]
MAPRHTIAAAVLHAARTRRLPLFVSNGFLCREVMALTAPGRDRVLPLQGGMGLATGVAAGYVMAAGPSGPSGPCGAIVLEGDGNHQMGWGCAQLVGAHALPLVHVVSCNGVYRSTGGQKVPARTDALTAAAALDYRQAFTAITTEQLAGCLERALALPGPSLIYAVEDGTGAPPDRSPFRTRDYTEALARQAAADREDQR